MAVMAGVVLVTATATAPAPADPATVYTSLSPRLATYNVFMLPQLLPPPWNPMTRADLIAQSGVLAGQDVVVLQEAFDNPASERLKSNLAPAYPYQTPVLGRSSAGWNATSGPFLWELRPEDGGVAILSRWPIRWRSQHIYASSCGNDGWSAKGFAYVRIDAPGPYDLHVIGTHAQADDGLCLGSAPSVRAAQQAEIAAFLHDAAIPSTDTVIIAGDLNVSRLSTEYPAMVSRLGAAAVAFTGHPASYDPATNSVAATSGEPAQQLDYALLVKGHALPIGRWVNQTAAVHSPPWQVTQWLQTRTFTDFSDHYPVFAHAVS